MRLERRAFLVLGLMGGLSLATAATVLADDAALALVEKGIEAQGGRARLEEAPAVKFKMKGEIQTMGQAIPFTGEVLNQGPDLQKLFVDLDIAGQKFRVTHVLNRDKGWNQIGDATMELNKEELAEAQENAFSEYTMSLVPLRDKLFTVALAGEISVANRPAVGVNVSSQGRRDTSLYFDKETGLLVKVETRVLDETTAQEMTQETFLDDYKEVQNTKRAMKFVVKRDGKAFMDGELLDIQFAKKFDESEFAKP